VDDVSLVLHYDPPTDSKTYLHRSGRTARAGAAGVVVSLLLPDQVGQAKRRFRQAKVDPAVDRIRPGDAPITALIASGVPVEPKERTQRDNRRGPGGPGGRPHRDGGHRGGPRRSFGDRPRPSGERSSGERSYGERSSSDRSYGERGPRSAGRSRPSRYGN
jgi:superfamily II DNA/RNA helicase